MENKNIIMLKHHPMNVKFTNTFYTNQLDENDNIENYIVIDVTSRIERNKEFMKEHPSFAKDLSPFFIGPVISSDGVKANIFEIFWQAGKVYPCHDNNGKPNEAYFEWRNKFYSAEKCTKDLMRHTCKDLGYEHKDTKYFAYFDKKKNDWRALNYVESRKLVYVKEYAKLVYDTDSFKWLKSLVSEGYKIALVDFDAYNYYSDRAKGKYYEFYLNKCKRDGIKPTRKLMDFLNIKNMKDVCNCPFMAGGHAFVLKMLLQGDIDVANGEVIDKSGVLDI